MGYCFSSPLQQKDGLFSKIDEWLRKPSLIYLCVWASDRSFDSVLDSLLDNDVPIDISLYASWESPLSDQNLSPTAFFNFRLF